MGRFKFLAIIILMIAPILSILYKTKVKDISFIPQSSSDQWNVQITYDLKKISQKLELNVIPLPLLSSSYNQTIESEKFLSIKEEEVIKTDAGNMTYVDAEKNPKVSALYQMTIREIGQNGASRTPIDPKKLEALKDKYLDLGHLSQDNRDKLMALSDKIIIQKDKKRSKLRKIYYFITEEITNNENISSFDEALSLSQGSELTKAELMTTLARLNKIPARTTLVYKMEKGKTKYNLKKTYMTEVILGKSWYPINVNTLSLYKVPLNHLVFYHNVSEISALIKDDLISMTAAPVMVNKVDSVQYKEKLQSISGFFSAISLYSLPISMHAAFYTILLIPLGTLILSFGRNIIGVNSFGIFTPILLTLFFLETSIVSGLVFFSFVVLLGFLQRYILDKFYLLAIPRLSILLTLVIISYTAFSLIAYQEDSLFPGGGPLNYLPIVILTTFIERFSVHFIEEGTKNTMKALFGTIFISVLCYFVFEIDILKLALFNHPEILLFVIAINLMIGSYKGYRLSEFFRFKEFKKLRSNV